MPRGRRCRTLTPNQLARLEIIRRAGDKDHRSGFTYPEFKLSMNGDFKLDTLMRAMEGKPIWEHYHAYIVEWLDRYCPEKPLRDGKAAAGGERQDGDPSEAFQEENRRRKDQAVENGELDKEAAPPTRIIRGSR